MIKVISSFFVISKFNLNFVKHLNSYFTVSLQSMCDKKSSNKDKNF
jgi:hypothetical protein